MKYKKERVLDSPLGYVVSFASQFFEKFRHRIDRPFFDHPRFFGRVQRKDDGAHRRNFLENVQLFLETSNESADFVHIALFNALEFDRRAFIEGVSETHIHSLRPAK